MNLLKLSIVALFAIALASCGDSVQKNCEQADWAGTYNGTADCGDGDVEDVIITITASGTDAIVISYVPVDTTGGLFIETSYDPLTPDGCELDESATEAGLTFTLDADVNEGELTLIETLSDGTDASTCTITATRN